MATLFTHPRFGLFAPFVALFALACLGFGLWHWAAERMSDELAARGLQWESSAPHGFPARITLDLSAARFPIADGSWQNPSLTLTVMPFNLRHAVIDFLGPHRLTAGRTDLTLSHQGNLMSSVRDANGVLRAAFEAQKPRLSGRLRGQKLLLSADQMSLHVRRSDRADRTETAMQLRMLRIGEATGAAARPIARLQAAFETPAGFLQDGPSVGDRLALQRAVLERDGLTVTARGTLKLGATGFVDGKLDLDVVRLEALFDTLVEFGVLSPRDAVRARLFGRFGSALGGDTPDRISVPLHLRDGRVWLGPIDVAAAPRWR